MSVLGIDVSNHQSGINFAQVKASGRDFVVLKATEGTGFTDPTMAAYRKAAHAAGLIVGLYHFAGSSVAAKVYDPAAESDHFTQAVGTLAVGEFVALDFEPFGYTNLASYDMVQWAKTWLDRTAARLGANPFIYMAGAHLRGYTWTPVASTYGLWYAIYDQAPTLLNAVPFWGVPAMKQYFDKAAVPGVPTSPPCDVDVFFGTTAQLLAYGKGGAPAPTPPEDIVTPQDIAAISDAVANRMVGPEGAAWQEWNTAAAQAKAAVAAVAALSAKVDALAAAVAKMPTGGGTMPAACAMQGAVLAPKPA